MAKFNILGGIAGGIDAITKHREDERDRAEEERKTARQEGREDTMDAQNAEIYRLKTAQLAIEGRIHEHKWQIMLAQGTPQEVVDKEALEYQERLKTTRAQHDAAVTSRELDAFGLTTARTMETERGEDRETALQKAEEAEILTPLLEVVRQAERMQEKVYEDVDSTKEEKKEARAYLFSAYEDLNTALSSFGEPPVEPGEIEDAIKYGLAPKETFARGRHGDKKPPEFQAGPGRSGGIGKDLQGIPLGAYFGQGTFEDRTAAQKNPLSLFSNEAGDLEGWLRSVGVGFTGPDAGAKYTSVSGQPVDLSAFSPEQINKIVGSQVAAPKQIGQIEPWGGGQHGSGPGKRWVDSRGGTLEFLKGLF